LTSRVAAAFTQFGDKERAQRIVLETVLERLGESGGGDGTGNESDADRLELIGRKRFGSRRLARRRARAWDLTA
jgi:hypothetical protein